MTFMGRKTSSMAPYPACVSSGLSGLTKVNWIALAGFIVHWICCSSSNSFQKADFLI